MQKGSGAGRKTGAAARVTIAEETPVGIEPTSTGLQPVAWPSGSSVVSSVPARSRTWPTTFAESRAVPPHSEDHCNPYHPHNKECRTDFQSVRRFGRIGNPSYGVLVGV